MNGFKSLIHSLGAMISKDFLNILACPVCKGALEAAEDSESLLCTTCTLKFRIRDGIPIMLADEERASGE